MTAFAQTSDGDIALADGKTTLISGTEEKAQKIQNRLSLFRGEWFLDTRIGVPYFEQVFLKAPDVGIVRQLLRKAILSVPGIEDVTDVDVTFDKATRKLSYSFTAVDDTGTPIPGGSGEPFIVEV